MDQTATIPCDIVLLPNDELAAKAYAASALFKDHGSLIVLKDGEVYSHMSLYMFELAKDKISAVENVLKEIAKQTSQVAAEATGYVMGQGFATGYIDSDYLVTQELRSLQTTVIEQINPLRAGMRAKDIAKMEDATGEKLHNLQTYGYPSVGGLFRPHMTLARLDSYRPEALDILPSHETFNGIFDKIGLFEMGDNGTCVRKIATVPLGR